MTNLEIVLIRFNELVDALNKLYNYYLSNIAYFKELLAHL